jgi:hypothetical protein
MNDKLRLEWLTAFDPDGYAVECAQGKRRHHPHRP